MCGICGVFEYSKTIDKGLINKMCRSIRHRGPDEGGSYIRKGIGIGMQRLSIIDVKGGMQPIHNENKTLWVVFNGEIYNYKILRKRLEEKGHKFKTETDTEVLLHMYEEHGEKFVEKLDGMFAFCIWDSKNKKLFLARDRFGKKPLHYAKIGKTFIFGSEIKALLVHPKVRKKISKVALRKYLLYASVPAPLSIFEDIKKLPAASYMTVDQKGQINENTYWNLDLSTKPKLKDKKEIEKKVCDTLKKSIEKRLMSEVPLGVFLSGGIDSSLIVALLREENPEMKIKTFSIGFEEESFDESKYAEQVAKIYTTEHHLKKFSSEEALGVLPKIIEDLDEPLADPSILPTYLVSNFTRKHVTVALSGDGGDEMFGGYPKYFAQVIANHYAKIPKPLRKMLLRAADALPLSPDNKILNYKVKRFLKGMVYPPEIRNSLWVGPFSPEYVDVLLGSGQEKRSNEEDYSEIYKHLSTHPKQVEIVDKMMYLDSKLMLHDVYLVKVDRMSMANSLEVRSPFLDKDLVGLVEEIPSNLKVRGLKTKVILKNVASRYLPKELIYRKKTGFGIPLAKWIRTKLKKTIQHTLSEENIQRDGIFNYEGIRTLLEDHFNKKIDRSIEIWTLFMFQLWYNKMMRNERIKKTKPASVSSHIDTQ